MSAPHSALSDIAQINLASELSEQAGARAVLEAIGADQIGVMSFSAIASALGGGSAAHTAITRAMQMLRSKGIVAIDVPAGSSSGRLKRYRIADSYLRFWFAFVEPQLRNIDVGRSDLALRAFKESWLAWRGKAIEPLVREAILRLAPSLQSPCDTIEQVSGWWDRTGAHEYDVVGLDRSGTAVLVGEVKWRQRAQRGAVARKRLINRHNVYVTLIDQTARVPTLDEPTLDRLAAALDRDGVVAAMLVGSQARGSAGPLSDVDVAVWHDRRLDSAKRLKLRLALAMDASRALGTDEVDIILLNGASPLMRHRAIRDGKRLIERDSKQRVQLESRALLDYLDTAPLRAELARGLRHRIEEGRFGRRRER